MNKGARGRHVGIVRLVRVKVRAVHLLQTDVLHQVLLAVLPPAGDVLHVIRVVDCLVPGLVPFHLTVTTQGVL